MGVKSLLLVCCICVLEYVAYGYGAQDGLVYSSDMEMDNNQPDQNRIRCEVCQAMVRGLVYDVKKMKPRSFKGGRMVALSEILENICSPEHFRVFEFSPPDMIDACRAFQSDHADELEQFVADPSLTTLDDTTLRQKLCLGPVVCREIWPEDKYSIDPVTGRSLPKKSPPPPPSDPVATGGSPPSQASTGGSPPAPTRKSKVKKSKKTATHPASEDKKEGKDEI